MQMELIYRMKKNKRFLVGRLVRRGEKNQVTQDEITRAILRFKARGGLIQELPPQSKVRRPLVGNSLNSAYETVIEH